MISSTFSYRFVCCLKTLVFRKNLTNRSTASSNRSTGSPATDSKSVTSSRFIVWFGTVDRLAKRSTVFGIWFKLKVVFWVTYKRFKFYFAHSKKANEIFWYSLNKSLTKLFLSSLNYYLTSLCILFKKETKNTFEPIIIKYLKWFSHRFVL